MKKIAILTERLKTGFGVDLVVHEQASRLAKKHQVAVMPIEAYLNEFKDTPYSISPIPIPLRFNPLKQDYWTYKYWREYQGILEKFDTFIIQTPTFNAWLPKLKKMGKVILGYYGNSPSYGYKGLKKYRKQLFDLTEKNFYFHYPDQIVSISNFLKQELPKKIQQKTIVNYLGSDHVRVISKKISQKRQKQILREYFIKPEEKFITYVGRLDYRENPYKNTYDLIKLRRSLDQKKHPKIKILAIGFPQGGIEQEMFKEGIMVVPNAPLIDLVGLLKASYLFFSPTLWEGFNLPLVEAQALGVPVVAYKTGAHREVVIEGKTGYLTGNFSQAVNKIRQLVESPSKRQKMAEAASRWGESFSWDKNVANLEQFL